MSPTPTLLALLERHYIKPGAALPGGVFVPEVGANGGFGAGRRCDAIYAGFTSASGRILIGHELKVSRADWLAELNNPGKADAWADECHEWWLVVPDPAIVLDGELPAGWGLMHPGGRSSSRMRVRTTAHRKDPGTHLPSWDTVRSVLARLDTLRANTIEERIKAARARIRADNDSRINALVELELAHRAASHPEAGELARRVAAIEDALGARIDWDEPSRGHPLMGGDTVSITDLRLLADAVRATGDVRRAVLRLTDGWANPVAHTHKALDGLDAALIGLRQIIDRPETLAEGKPEACRRSA
jgi:hypothetical protein